VSLPPLAAFCAAAALALGEAAAACDDALQEPRARRASAACGDPNLRLTIADGLVSLEARDARVGAVVAAIATRASLVVASGDELEDAITDSFAVVPLATALARVLGRRSFLLQTQAPDAAGRRGWLWILGAGPPPAAAFDGPAATPQDTSGTSLASTVDYESMKGSEALMSVANALATGDAPARRSAVHELGDLEPAAALPLLRQGLGDPDRAVRVAAVRELDALGAPAADALAAALDDRDLGIRLRALDALARIETPTARPWLEQALGHADARVRAAAAEHLRNSSAAGR
jgi:hypothetical protein